MCGIVGVLQYKTKVPRHVRQRALRILFSETMLKTEVRGEDATGIYQVHENGDWAMTKKGVKASQWMFLDSKESEDPVVYSDFMDGWAQHPHDLTALVGHCRKATVGSKGKDNEDNHPFAVQLDQDNAILGIHNGTLDNHEIIFKKLPPMLKRQGKVDSEAIFHLMFHLSEHGTKPWDGEIMKNLGKRLEGAYACIVVNSRFPNKVATFRDGRPMEFFLIAPLNIVLICSEKKFADAALEKYEFIRRLLDPELPALQTYDAALVEKDYRIFDTALEFPEGKPTFQDLNRISERGDIRTFNGGLEEGWKVEKTTTTTTYPPTTPTTYKGGTQYSGTAGTAAAKTSKADDTVKALPAKIEDKKDDDAIVTVEVEIGSEEEAKKGYEKAKSLGLSVHYDSENEVAKTLGLTQIELDKLTKVELANLLSATHFNFGYAVSRFDYKAEIEDVRKKGRDQNKRLEKSEEKKRRAENHVWELKQLVSIMLALMDSKFSVTEQNIGISLTAFAKLSDQRKKDIMKMAKDILSDKGVRQVVSQLRSRYKEAAERKTRRKEKSAE
jgi:hypothetical protein